MNTTQYSLSDFLRGCDGRWENAIYVSCGSCAHPCHLKRRGYLLTASPSGELILIGVSRYEQLSGQEISPECCAASISRDAFQSAFSRYLLWELEHAGQCPLCRLEAKTDST